MDKALFHGDLVKSDRILYTPSSFAKTSLLHLQEIGELEALEPHTSSRKDLASYLFFMVLKGSGSLEYEGNAYTLSPRDCVFLDCRKAYSHRTSADLWKLKWVHFYGANMGDIYDKYTERGGAPCFHPKDPALYEDIWRNLYNIASSSDYIRDMKIYEKLTMLLTLLMEESWHPEKENHTASKRQNLQNVKTYLDEHYADKISLDQLSEVFFINKFYLTRVFKEQFGLSINNYLLQKRITHAKQLLRFTDDTIETIGAECGISDPNYFSRVFKQVEGISPGEYRKMW